MRCLSLCLLVISRWKQAPQICISKELLTMLPVITVGTESVKRFHSFVIRDHVANGNTSCIEAVCYILWRSLVQSWFIVTYTATLKQFGFFACSCCELSHTAPSSFEAAYRFNRFIKISSAVSCQLPCPSAKMRKQRAPPQRKHCCSAKDRFYKESMFPKLLG